MNDEIKEMLELHIKYDIDLLPKNQKTVLDYITNLQQENDNLKNIISSVKEDFLNANNELTNLQQENERYGEELYKDYLEKQVKDYKSRIEEAVEYIKADYINGLVDGLSWLEVLKLVKNLNGRSDENE